MVESKLSSRLLKARATSRTDQQTAYRRCNSDPALTGKLITSEITPEQAQLLRKCVPIVQRQSVGNKITSKLRRVFVNNSANNMRHSMIDESTEGTVSLKPPTDDSTVEGRLSFTSTSTGYSSARSSVRSSADHTVQSSGSGSPSSAPDTHAVHALLRLEESYSAVTRKQLTAAGKEPNYLHRIAMELLDTERAYVNDLHYVIEGYLNPILRDRQHLCVTTLDISNLFGCVERVFQFNRQLYAALDGAQYDLLAMADVFVQLDEGFGVYDEFCTLYPKMAQSLERLSQQETVVAFLDACQRNLQHHLPLGTYLLKPIQRVLKYHLFLQNALDHWPKHTQQTNRLRAALNCMTARAQHINEVKRREEHSSRVTELQRMISTNHKEGDTCELLDDYGDLVLEATFKLAQSKHQSRRVLLFDEMLLVCKEKPDDSLVCKDYILCADMMLYKTLTNLPLAFRVSSIDQKVQYSFVASTDDQRQQWVDEIARLVRQYTPTPIKDKRFVKGNSKISGPSRVKKYLSKRRKSSDGPTEITRRLSLVGNGIDNFNVDYNSNPQLSHDCMRSASTSNLAQRAAMSQATTPHKSSFQPTKSHVPTFEATTSHAYPYRHEATAPHKPTSREATSPIPYQVSHIAQPPPREMRARSIENTAHTTKYITAPDTDLPTRRHYGNRGRAATTQMPVEPVTDIETSFAELWHDLHMFAAENHVAGLIYSNTLVVTSDPTPNRAAPQFPVDQSSQQNHYANTTKPRMPPPKTPRSALNSSTTTPRSTLNPSITTPRSTLGSSTAPTPRRDVPEQFLAAEQRLAALVARKNAKSTVGRVPEITGRLPVVRVLSGVRTSTDEFAGYSSDEGDYDDYPMNHLGVVKNMVKQWQTENV